MDGTGMNKAKNDQTLRTRDTISIPGILIVSDDPHVHTLVQSAVDPNLYQTIIARTQTDAARSFHVRRETRRSTHGRAKVLERSMVRSGYGSVEGLQVLRTGPGKRSRARARITGIGRARPRSGASPRGHFAAEIGLGPRRRRRIVLVLSRRLPFVVRKR